MPRALTMDFDAWLRARRQRCNTARDRATLSEWRCHRLVRRPRCVVTGLELQESVFAVLDCVAAKCDGCVEVTDML